MFNIYHLYFWLPYLSIPGGGSWHRDPKSKYSGGYFTRIGAARAAIRQMEYGESDYWAVVEVKTGKIILGLQKPPEGSNMNTEICSNEIVDILNNLKKELCK